jgi:molecular chaperone DnaK
MITSKVDAVKGALKADDLDQIKSTTAELEKSLGELAQAAQAAGAEIPDMETSSETQSDGDDEEPRKAKGKVVDAEVVDSE